MVMQCPRPSLRLLQRILYSRFGPETVTRPVPKRSLEARFRTVS